MEAGFRLGCEAASKKQRFDTDKTPGSFSASVLYSLGGNYAKFEGIAGEQPFMSQAEVIAAQNSMANRDGRDVEKYLVRFMAPLLTERLIDQFPTHYRLVNCERYRWSNEANELSPDHIICPHYLVRFRHPYESAPEPEGYDYGSFPVLSTISSLAVIGDCKIELSEKELGEFLQYLRNISFPMQDTRFIRGFVYDAKHCYLVTAINGEIQQVVELEWTAPGSRSYFRNYFDDVDNGWHCAIMRACTICNVELEIFSTVGLGERMSDECILGAGAFGRVLSVVQRNVVGDIERRVAMKVAYGDSHCQQLIHEFTAICSLPNDAIPFTMGVDRFSFRLDEIARPPLAALKVAAFLIPNIGKPFHHPNDVRRERSSGNFGVT
jgi:hypothetical protein